MSRRALLIAIALLPACASSSTVAGFDKLSMLGAYTPPALTPSAATTTAATWTASPWLTTSTPPVASTAPDALVPQVPSRPGVFDLTYVKSALRAARLSSCRSRGLPHGYIHAKVTFAPSGKVKAIAVDSPAELPQSAVACVGERTSMVGVAPFDGEEKTVGIMLFVD